MQVDLCMALLQSMSQHSLAFLEHSPVTALAASASQAQSLPGKNADWGQACLYRCYDMPPSHANAPTGICTASTTHVGWSTVAVNP